MASYFNATYYFAAKAKQLSTTEKTWTAAEVQAEFAKQGINAEDHYKAYGASEGLSPNAYFNEKEYLASKLAALQDNDPTWANKTVADLQAEFKALGINAADHYEQYGAFETRKDGTLLNPSNAFDANAYFAAKLAQLQKIGFEGADTMTVADVVKAVQEAGISPVAHLQAYGATEAKTDGIPLVQTVPVAQRVANDPARVANGELVPGNYNQPTKGPAAAVAAPVTKPADVGGLSATAPKLPSEPVKTPADAGFVAPPASLVDGPNDTIIPPTGTTGTGPNNSFIVVDSTGKGTVVNKDGTIQGTIDKVETDSNGNFVQPPLDVVIKDANGNNTNDKPADNTGNPVEPTPPTVDPEPENPVDPPAPALKSIALTGEGWVNGTSAVEIKAYRTDAEGAAAADGEYVTFIIGTDLATNSKKSTAFKVADYDVFNFSQYQKVTVGADIVALTKVKAITGKGIVDVTGAGDAQDISAEIWANNFASGGADASTFSGGAGADKLTLKAMDKAVYAVSAGVAEFETVVIDGASGSGSVYEVGALVDTADITFKGSAGNDTLVIDGGITDFATLKAAQLTHGGGEDVLKVTAAASLDYSDATSGNYFGKLNDYAVSGNQGFHTLLLDNGTSALADLDLSKLSDYTSIGFAGTGKFTLASGDGREMIISNGAAAGTSAAVKLTLGEAVSDDTLNLVFEELDTTKAAADQAELSAELDMDDNMSGGTLNVSGSDVIDLLTLKAASGGFANVAIKANMGAGADTVTLDLANHTSGSMAFKASSEFNGGAGEDTDTLAVKGTLDGDASVNFTNLTLTSVEALDFSGVSGDGSHKFTLTGFGDEGTTFAVSGMASGSTAMTMGTGNDNITFSSDSNETTRTLSIDTGKGADSVTLDGSASGSDTITLKKADYQTGEVGSEVLTFADTNADTITGFIHGSSSGDVLDVSSFVTGGSVETSTSLGTGGSGTLGSNKVHLLASTTYEFGTADSTAQTTLLTTLFGDSGHFSGTVTANDKGIVVIQGSGDSFVFYIENNDDTAITANEIGFLGTLSGLKHDEVLVADNFDITA